MYQVAPNERSRTIFDAISIYVQFSQASVLASFGLLSNFLVYCLHHDYVECFLSYRQTAVSGIRRKKMLPAITAPLKACNL